MGKNLTRQLLKERIASGEFAEEKKDNTVKPKNETPLQPGQKKHLLNPRAYKDHIKARDILAQCIGATSELFFKEKINIKELRYYQVEGAKKAIRTTSLSDTLQAWDDLFGNFLCRLEEGKAKGVPIRCSFLAEFLESMGGIKATEHCRNIESTFDAKKDEPKTLVETTEEAK